MVVLLRRLINVATASASLMEERVHRLLLALSVAGTDCDGVDSVATR